MSEKTWIANYPAELLPYIQSGIGRAGALVAADKWEAYPYERFAQFTPAQLEYFNRVQNLGFDPRSLEAAGMTRDVYNRLYGAKYDPGKFNFGTINPQKLKQYQMAGKSGFGYKPEDWADKAAQAKAAQAKYEEKLKAYQMGKRGKFAKPEEWADKVAKAKAAQTKYEEKLRNFQIGKVKDVKGTKNLAKNAAQMEAARSGFKGDVKTKSFARPGTADKFMSPYMQSVVDIQQREAQRQADIAAQQRGAEAVQAGAFGGSRQAIMEAEAARNLAQQKGDIQAKGLQDAYAQAQAQFNQEQQAGLTAQQANLGANLQVAMGNLNNRQQAAVQNQAAKLQMQGMSAQQALQAALANQQTEMQRRQLNQQSSLGVQQLRSGNRMQIQMQNLANSQQTRLANAQREFEAQGMTKQQAFERSKMLFQDQFARENANVQNKMAVQQLRSGNRMQIQMQNLANNQQTELANVARQFEAQNMTRQQAFQKAALLLDDKFRRQNANLNAKLSVQQFGAGQNLTAQQFNRNLAMEAARMGEQSRQYGADYGYRNMMGALQSGQVMGGLGQNMYGQGLTNLQLYGNVGNQQQAGVQKILDAGYQDYLTRNRFPYEQLAFKSGVFRGLPNPTGQGLYGPPPSAFNQGVGLLSAYSGFQQQPGFSINVGGGGGGGNAKGGVIPPAGLMDLAMSRAYA